MKTRATTPASRATATATATTRARRPLEVGRAGGGGGLEVLGPTHRCVSAVGQEGNPDEPGGAPPPDSGSMGSDIEVSYAPLGKAFSGASSSSASLRRA